MPSFRTLLVSLVILETAAASAQERPPMPRPATAPVGTVVGCTSLANLRLIFQKAKDDPVAAAAVANETKSDLSCVLLEPPAVTGIVDRLTLNGRAYDCVGLQTSSICHWTIAGAITPAAVPAREPSSAPKPRR